MQQTSGCLSQAVCLPGCRAAQPANHCGSAACPFATFPTNTNQLTRPPTHNWQVATFLEANGRGYWEAKPEQLERLRQMYM